MQITISKQTAKTLRKAIWLTIGTCDNNRKGEGKFEPNEAIMKNLGVSTEQLYHLSELSKQITKKLSTKNKRR